MMDQHKKTMHHLFKNNYNWQLYWSLSSAHILQTFDLTVPPNKSKTTYNQFSNTVSYKNMNIPSSHTTYKCEWCNPAKRMVIQKSAPTAAANPLYLIYFSLLCSELGKRFASISPVKVNGCGHGCGSEIQDLSHAIWTFSISAHLLQFLIRFPSYYLTATISLHSLSRSLAPTTMG